MAGTNNPQRRRAAWAVLSTVLDEDALIDALWLQHDSMRGESVSDIIAFVDAISAQHLLDAATRKRLYSAYFDALRQAEDTLPMDPWPLMLQARPSAAGPASGYGGLPRAMPGGYPNPNAPTYGQPMVGSAPAAPVYVPPPAPAYVPPVVQAVRSAAENVPAPAPVAASEPVEEAPAGTPMQAVFGALVTALFRGVRQFHPEAMGDLLLDCRARLEHVRLAPGLRQAARDALTAPAAHAWYLDASQDEFSTLAHEFYVSLCESLGPVDADHVLMQAVRQAERLPQAREVPPGRFL